MSAVVAANVEASWTLDVPNLQRRMDGAVLRVLKGSMSAMLRDVRKKWRGWVYKGRPTNKRNVSLDAWTGTIQATEAPYSFTIGNAARAVYTGKPYVNLVHRAGSSEFEVDVVFAALAEDQVPKLQAALTAAILAELGKPGAVKRRRLNKASDARRMIL